MSAATSAPSDDSRDPPTGSQSSLGTTPGGTAALLWCVRRELWENRSIVIGPLAAAACVLVGFLISALHHSQAVDTMWATDPAKMEAALARAYGFAAIPIIATTFLVAVFYCLDALYGERRDRSILFWKSLPVSDRTTVLSKATIPMVVLPLFAAAVVIVTQWIVLLMSLAVFVSKGVAVTALWIQLPLFRMPIVVLYGLITLALWHAPIYGWLLIVSAWAKRNAFLWAVLPPLALLAIEKIAFGTSYVGMLLKYRLMGGFLAAFAITESEAEAMHRLPALDPIKFVTTPGLWIGLAFGAAFVAGAVWLRRYREPI